MESSFFCPFTIFSISVSYVSFSVSGELVYRARCYIVWYRSKEKDAGIAQERAESRYGGYASSKRWATILKSPGKNKPNGVGTECRKNGDEGKK